jgi:hypothetical protein
MAAAIPFYKSPQTIGLVTTFVSAAIALYPKAGQLLGLNAPGAVERAVTTVFAFIALLAPLIGVIVRTKSTVQPITLTQAAADAHPVTQAAAVPTQAMPTPIIAAPLIPGKPWGK